MNTVPDSSARRRWPAYLLLALAVLSVAIVSVSSWLLLDDDRMRAALEKGVTALTDRPFHVDGDFAISVGRVTTISGSRIRWLNPEWSKQPNMLSAGKLSLSIDLWSLIRGPIVISNAQADDAQLFLEWTREGQFNWDMRSGRKDAETPSTPIHLLLRETALRKVDIRVRHPALTGELVINVARADQHMDAENRLLIAADATVKERAFHLQGQIGPFSELIAGGAIDYRFDLGADVVSLAASGRFDQLSEGSGPRLDLELLADDAREVLKTFQLPEVTRGKVSLQAHVAPASDGLDGLLKGNFGEFNVDARLAKKISSSSDEFSLVLDSDGPDIGALGRLAGIDNLPAQAYTVQVDASRRGQELQLRKLFFVSREFTIEASGVAHKFPQLSDLELDLSAKAENLQKIGQLFSVAFLPALPLNVKASIKRKAAGGDDQLQGHFALGNTTGEVSGQLTRAKGLADSTFRYRASSPDLRELARARGLRVATPLPVPTRIDGEFSLRADQLRIDSFTAKIADDQLSATGLMDFRHPDTLVELEPRMTGPDLAGFVGLFLGDEQAVYVPSGSYDLTGKLTLQGSRLRISSKDAQAGGSVFGFDGAVDLGGKTPTIDAKITAKGPNLATLLKPEILKGVPATAFSLSTVLKMSERGLALDELNLSLAEGSLSGRLSTGWPRQPERIEFDLKAAGSNLRASLPQIPGYLAAPVAFRVDARGSADETSVNIERLNGTLTDAQFELAGKVAFKPSFSADAVRLSAKGSKLSALGSFTAWHFADLPFALSGTMSGNTGNVRMDDLQATLGDSDLKGSLHINTTARPHIALNVRSQYLDLRPFLGQVEGEASVGKKDAGRNKLFSDKPLPVEVLRAFDGKLLASLAKVEARQQQLQDVRAEASLQDGLLVVKRIQGQARQGKVDANFTLDSRGKRPTLKGQLQATDVAFFVRGMTKEDEDRLPRHRLDSRFSASGDSFSALAAGLDGYLWLRSSPGQFRSRDMGLLFGDFAFQLFNTLNPFARKDPYSTLSCGGAYFESKNGRVETAPAAVLQTNEVSVISRGSVDLRSEKIDLVFKVVPLHGVGLSAGALINPFLKLGGTLLAPAMDLSVGKAAVEGGVAFATFGVSLLAGGLWDRWIASSGACDKVFEEARKIRSSKNPQDVPGF